MKYLQGATGVSSEMGEINVMLKRTEILGESQSSRQQVKERASLDGGASRNPGQF